MYQLFNSLARPYVLCHLFLALLIFRFWYRRELNKRSLIALSAGWMALYALSLVPVSYLLSGTLEWAYPPRNTWPSRSDAIVVLSGSFRNPDSVRLRAEAGSSTMYRCLHAAEIYHEIGPIAVLVSGGTVSSKETGPGCASVMNDLLTRLGVEEKDILLEGKASSTYENAMESAKILDKHNFQNIILVTDAKHMRRAEMCFRKQGVSTCASACNHDATELKGSLFDHLTPNPHAVVASHRVLHEWLGIVWYKLKGRI